MSKVWLTTNISKVFPPQHTENFRCALSGLAYAQYNKSIYELLLNSSTIIHALRLKIDKGNSRERLLELVGLAYLWNIEQLSNERFSWLAKNECFEELQSIADLYWRIGTNRDDGIDPLKILDFWEYCIALPNSKNSDRAKLMSELSELVCFIDELGEREFNLLMAVAPYTHINYRTDSFTEFLLSLVTTDNVDKVIRIFKTVLKHHTPTYDYKDHTQQLVRKIAQTGIQGKLEAIKLAENLRHLDSMVILIDELSDG
jgi:hypothetical protein